MKYDFTEGQIKTLCDECREAYGDSNSEFLFDLLDEIAMSKFSRMLNFYVLVKDRRQAIKIWREHGVEIVGHHFIFHSSNAEHIFGFNDQEDYNFYKLVDRDNIIASADIQDMLHHVKNKLPTLKWLDKYIN